ncbi:MAG: hypothetical protein U0804_01480 [Gemmataceae bacterium]
MPDKSPVVPAVVYAAHLLLEAVKPFRELPRQVRFEQPDEALYGRLAEAHETALHSPTDARVAESYAAFVRETQKQFEAIASRIEVEPWLAADQPYANSNALFADLRAWHLYFFTGGDLPVDHPLGALSPYTLSGFALTWNHVFRCVHDAIGHGLYLRGFGPVGEYHAWVTHAQLYSATALPALANETVMQSAAFYYGKHSQVPRPQRPFPAQKAYLPPDDVHQPRPLFAEELGRPAGGV